MLKNMHRISVKYASAFIGVALSLLVVVVADFFFIESLKGRMNEFSTTFNKAVSEVLNADRDLYQARVAELEVLRTDRGSDAARAQLADYRENAQQAYDRMHDFIEDMAGYPDITRRLQGFEADYKAWHDASQRVFTLHEAGDRQAALAQLDGNSLTTFQALREHYDMAGEAANAKVAELHDASVAMANTKLWIIGVFSLVVFVAAMTIALVGPLMMSRAIRNVTARIKEIAEGDGDLTARIESTRRDEIGELADQFDGFIAYIDTTLQSVRASTLGVTTASDEIAKGSVDLASRTEQAASNLQETSASMEQISATVSNTSDAAQQANKLVHSTSDIAREGREAMQQVERTMDEINSSATQISEIIGMIDGIAFQTNILALNASVEAARAGEHGRGFAVVAQEVRTLASRSGEAAKSIRELIDTSVSRTQSGNELVKRTGRTMSEIVASIEQVTDVIGEISAGAKEQSQGIGQVNTAVSELDNMTQHNAAMVEQFSAASGEMREQAERLNALIASFRLSGEVPEASSAPRLNAPQTAATGQARPVARRGADESTDEEWATF
ncbi:MULTISPECIES: methyl-accepting chemotaxis protein [unclassified Modicisalibacter]|uniref:methyl-accepting chemotaxis protein n=1 Tax=unclassified Modicisalibacter TaxID=2679913 RepID=UPI001CCD196A|nr:MULTISPECIES: methyl-accepting chemotaxis protein [unclassified Modicisalibacter]MBZ9557530.1 HAMP domain-containing protein [Modicisalibacter sp. R2A 31.J]MBZ9573805.1 HAMP domain-containing protein [Modicisalibacter sp. MOD 31.J]